MRYEPVIVSSHAGAPGSRRSVQSPKLSTIQAASKQAYGADSQEQVRRTEPCAIRLSMNERQVIHDREAEFHG